MYDLAIIGAGVTGSAIAREMARYQLRIVILEKRNDVATGSSKANSGIIHAGYDCEPGTLMARLNALGSRMMPQVCSDLDVAYNRCGSFVVAVGPEEEEGLKELYNKGVKNNIQGLEILRQPQISIMEPRLSKEITAVLWAPTAAIVSPYELTIAMAENAIDNGADIRLNFDVVSIHNENSAFTIADTKGNTVEAMYVVNAAGLYADHVNHLAGAKPIRILPRKGEYLLLDRQEGSTVSRVIFQVPTKMGKGVLVSPTVDGNLFTGPTAEDITDKEDYRTTPEGLASLKKLSVKSVPGINFRNVITQFTGIRAIFDGNKDFVIEETDVKRFINAAGISSPGLSSAPAIALEVRDILSRAGMRLELKKDHIVKRSKPKHFREMSLEEKKQAVAKDPNYGRVVCRCETVTEAEIISAIHAKIPATTLDAVKRRTRAGMGRCQGGFCGPRIMEILSRELGVDKTQIRKFGDGSKIVCRKTKDTVARGEDCEY